MKHTQQDGSTTTDDYHTYKSRLKKENAVIHPRGGWTDQNKYKVILDSAASVNVFYNKDLIEDIQYTANPKEVTTGGCMKLFYEQMGNLKSILIRDLLPHFMIIIIFSREW